MSDSRASTEDDGVRRRRSPWPLAVVAVLFVVVPFLTWYWTWFGRSLGDEEIGKYLSEGNPRHAQHALSQIAEAYERGDAAAARWNAQVTGLASSPSPDVRMTAAWAMGIEHRSEEFRESLARLVADPEPIVRHNAALALVRFGDPRCRPELLAMLRPYTVIAQSEGTALTALTAGSNIKRETLLVRYTVKPNLVEEIRSPLPGVIERALIKEGDAWHAGAELFVIAPDFEQTRGALIGLAYFGEPGDVPEIERFAAAAKSDEIKREAAQTAEAIKRRSGSR
ncbi:MAG: HEAT repeat domain-containing protein [Pyrinomonadaceae bacterium]